MSGPETAPPPLSPVEPLTRSHETAFFDCGNQPSLNDWLKRFAWTNQQNETSRTYIVHRAQRIAGYYSIAAGAVLPEDVPPRIAKGLAKHPVPILLLARLAVDQSEKGKGLGGALLKDALKRMANAADIVGARAVLVHALDAEAAAFYRHFNFEPSPVSDLQLMLLMKDLRSLLAPPHAHRK